MSDFYRQGEVISIAGESADVQLSLEGFCSGEHKCLFAAFTQDLPSERNKVRVHNPIGAKEGEKVVVEILSPGFYRALFFVFIFPLIALIGGGIFGNELASWVGLPHRSDLFAGVGAVLFCAIALLIGRFIDRQVTPRYSIYRKVDELTSCEECVLKSR
jgi:sigma-E factor negative regulatory protein RseC